MRNAIISSIGNSILVGVIHNHHKGKVISDYWHSAKIMAGILSGRVLTGPHSVQVSIADACNYRCVMCWEHSSEIEGRGADDLARTYHAGKKNKAAVMDFDVYDSFVRSLRKTGTRDISFAGIGEPLLHKRIVEAVALAKDLDMRVWITTNGSLLTPELMQELARAGLDDINVSLNAGASGEYSFVHVNQENSRFDEIIENLAWLRDYKRKQGLETPRLTLSNVVCNLNSHRAFDMMKAAVAAGAGAVSYRPVDIYEQTAKYALGAEDMKRLEGQFPLVARLARDRGIVTNIDSFYRLLEMRAGGAIPSPCFAGWLYPFVLANGDVTYCCISRQVLGNLGERSFESIWFDPSRRAMNAAAVKMHKTQQSLPKSRCRGCEQTLANLRIYRYAWPRWGRKLHPLTGDSRRV